MPIPPPRRLLAPALVTALVTAVVATSAFMGAGPGNAASLPSSGGDRAEQTLQRAEALLSGGTAASAPSGQELSTTRREADPSVVPHDATLLLRDLARQADELPTAAQRATAVRLLARPDDGRPRDRDEQADPKYARGAPVGSACGADICVHWVEDRSANAVRDDRDVLTVPGWVRTTLSTMEHVYADEVGRLGYRAPLSDAGRTVAGRTVAGDAVDRDGRVDVYLADLGRHRLYGYCTSDQPDRNTARRVFGYCVLDNDFAPSQFPTHTPLQNLRVTAAHEFFHLVQFGYDWWEDAWLMEGTAAWMEDEVYDRVNDNLQYLSRSPLAYPSIPLDHTGYGYGPYGSWVFWRFLSEWSGRGGADDPGIVRRVWESATGSPYSAQALARVLRSRRSSFASAFAAFGTWSREPARYFSEGRRYPAAPLARRFLLTRAHPASGSHSAPLDHMSHRFIRFAPGSGLTGRWRLRVTVDLASPRRGSLARLVVRSATGRVAVVPVHLDGHGNGTRTVSFRHGAVRSVELQMGDASLRFRCGQETGESCRGRSYDDDLRASFRAVAVRG